MADEAGEAVDAIGRFGEERSPFEKTVDRRTRDIERWVAEQREGMDDAGAKVTDHSKQAVDSLEDDLTEVGNDVEELAKETDAEWESARKDIEKNLDTIQQNIESL